MRRLQVTELTPLVFIVVLIPSVILHEVAHGWIAEKLGDPTAREAGRITLNPLPHIDLWGTIIIPAVLAFTGAPVLGWAKPVPVRADRLRDPVKGMALVGLAGPAVNLALAFVAGRIILPQFDGATATAAVVWAVTAVWALGIVNVVLAVFNLLPIPPLDGSRVIGPFVGAAGRRVLARVEPYGMLAVFALILVPGLSVVFRTPMDWLRGVVGL